MASPNDTTAGFRLNESGNVANFNLASSSCFDVVLLAGGVGNKLNPVTNVGTNKAQVQLANKPLYWHSIKAWLNLGVRHVYICASPSVAQELEAEASWNRDFSGAQLTVVVVKNRSAQDAVSVGSNVSGGSNATLGTCNAIRSYMQFKRKLPTQDPRSQPRDVLVASVDLVMAGVDMWPFVRNFYDEFYSAAALYYEPYAAFDRSRGKAADIIAIEPPTTNSTDDVHHCRLHNIEPIDDFCAEPKWPAGVFARRLNLTFTSAFVDSHTYMLRNWIAEFIDFHTDLDSIKDDLLPLLAGRQLPTIPADGSGLQLPHVKLGMDRAIPIHWALSQTTSRSTNGFSIASLNAVQQINPEPWDELRVGVSIYRASPRARMIRVNTLSSYHACSREILAGLAKPADATALAQVMIPYCQYATQSTLAHAAASASDADGPPKAVSLHYSSVLSMPLGEAKIATSVVGKDVEIGEGVTLRDCVLLAGSRVAAGAKLTNVILGPGSEAKGTLTGVALSATGDETKFDDDA